MHTTSGKQVSMLRSIAVRWLFKGALALVGVMAVACSATPQVERVTVSEWSFRLDHSSVPAGQVTLEAVNQGQATHEMVLLKTDLPTNALKVKANGAEVDESASGEIMGEVEDLRPGQTKSVTVNLAPGRYVLTCNLLGHYNAGMVTEFTVTSS